MQCEKIFKAKKNTGKDLTYCVVCKKEKTMDKKSIDKFLKLVKFDKKGLVPVVVQDNGDGTVLMVAYMNKKSLFITMKEGRTCFWSRSRYSVPSYSLPEVFGYNDGGCSPNVLQIRTRRFGGVTRSPPIVGFLDSRNGSDIAIPDALSTVRREMGVCMEFNSVFMT